MDASVSQEGPAKGTIPDVEVYEGGVGPGLDTGVYCNVRACCCKAGSSCVDVVPRSYLAASPSKLGKADKGLWTKDEILLNNCKLNAEAS